MQVNVWFLFLLASIGLSITPGPNSLLVLTHGVLHGRRKTLWTIMGGVLGLVTLSGLSMFGIGALVAKSVAWFTALKIVGGAYLVWLGIRVWRSPPLEVSAARPAIAASGPSLFRTGYLTAVTNPKGLLFFSALLPQFIDPHRSLLTQFIVIALTYGVSEFAVEYLFAATAQSMGNWLARVGKRFNQVCGAIFIAVGAALPLH